MHIKSATLRNFRMHLDTTVTFGDTTTVIVGRNNSGKTAVAELFRRFFGDHSGRGRTEFTLDDFSVPKHEALLQAARSSVEDNHGRIEPPGIELELSISYADSVDNLSAMSDFIVDLDDNCTETKILLKYSRSTGPKGENFYDDLPANNADAFDALDARLRQTYEVVVEAIDPTDDENRTEQPLSALLERVQLGFVDAARPMEGDRNREPDTLGRTLSSLFDASRMGHTKIPTSGYKPLRARTKSFLRYGIQSTISIGTCFPRDRSRRRPGKIGGVLRGGSCSGIAIRIGLIGGSKRVAHWSLCVSFPMRRDLRAHRAGSGTSWLARLPGARRPGPW